MDIMEPAAINLQFALNIPCRSLTPTGKVYKDLFVNLAKMVVIGAVSYALCFLTAKSTELLNIQNQSLLEITRIMSVTFVLAISYVVLSLVFKIGYVDEVKDRILAKIKK